ncbi:MAG TPA: FHA domain-containing protein [Polyangiaceae bacterium]|nr:FHA domain-containing protein [Polyangiaceae bacterium]
MISPTSTAQAPVFAVVIHEKGGAERRETFETSELTVGRVQGNELMLPKGNVSKRHARLLYRDGRFIVTDLNSTNGTYVNRRRITQATIVREGDRIYVGDFVLRIELPGGDGAQRPAPDAASSPELSQSSDEVSTTGPAPGAASMPARRPAITEDDELGRLPAPGRAVDVSRSPTASAVTDSPARPGSFPANETTGTHHVGRTTQEDAPSYERSSLGMTLQLVVQSAVERLGAQEFEGALAADLRERVEPILAEAVSRVTNLKEAPLGLTPERLLELAREELLELGPLGDLLADASVTEIGVVRFDQVMAVRSGRSVPIEPGFSSERSLAWAMARLRAEASEGGSELEFRLANGGRVSVDPATSGKPASLHIRKVERLALTLDELVRRGVISRAIATFFRHCLLARVNVLVVGGHDGSSEQLLAALIGSQGDARLVSVGDGVASAAEVSVDFGLGSVADARRALAVKSAISGVRFAARLSSPEVTAAVTEMVASGVDGVLALRHATSIKRALLRLSAEIAAARPGLGVRATRELLAGAYDVVVEVARLRDDRVRVLRIVELTGVTGEEIAMQDIFTFIPDRTAAGGAVEGTFSASGNVPQIVESMRSRGENLDSSLFSRPPSR